jgi:hypothetical protein
MKFENLKEMKDEYINQNALARIFLQDRKILSINSLCAFFRKYEEKDKNGKKKGSASFSERVFSYWTMKILNGKPCETHYSTQNGQPLVHNKKFDFFFEGKGKKKVFIEFKCNVDNIEKDLYKFWLLKRDRDKADKNIITALVIWEGNDNSKRKKIDEDSSYMKLLKDASVKKRNILNKYFYFPINNSKKLREGIKNYINFLTDFK